MKKCFLAMLLAFSSPLLALAETARPDVDELLTVMRAERSMQSAMDQVKQMIPQMMANMAAQSGASPEEAAKMAPLQGKIMAIMMEEMSWKKMKPQMAAIYAESLTPEEVKGVIAFYKSPAGQAYLDKEPVIMKKTMEMQQNMMMGLMPKIQAAVKSELESKSQPAK